MWYCSLVAFLLRLFWALNGVAFVVLLFSTEQWQRLVPRTLEVIPNAVSTAIQYSSFRLPHENGWVRYNALQQLAYFAAVFIAAPLQILTGLAMAPAVGNHLRASPSSSTASAPEVFTSWVCCSSSSSF